mmetsp:Transcript_33025/g.46089  ORF Transcript_33025/g.46089 Transcript_33025/m.46089 type:complete len:248 (-) Transcript_33025:219-962(-)
MNTPQRPSEHPSKEKDAGIELDVRNQQPGISNKGLSPRATSKLRSSFSSNNDSNQESSKSLGLQKSPTFSKNSSSKTSFGASSAEAKKRRTYHSQNIQKKRLRKYKKLRRTLTTFIWTIPPIWLVIMFASGALFVTQVRSDEDFSEDIDSEARSDYIFFSDISTYVTLAVGVWFQYYAHVPFHPNIYQKLKHCIPIINFVQYCGTCLLTCLCCCFYIKCNEDDEEEEEEESKSYKTQYFSKISTVDV